MGMLLKKRCTHNVRALTQNLRETKENGSSPVHLLESWEMSWDCACSVNVCVAIHEPDLNTCMCFVQNGLSFCNYYGVLSRYYLATVRTHGRQSVVKNQVADA
jgi:hypothetical protein